MLLEYSIDLPTVIKIIEYYPYLLDSITTGRKIPELFIKFSNIILKGGILNGLLYEIWETHKFFPLQGRAYIRNNAKVLIV